MVVDQLFVEVTSFGIDICFCVVLVRMAGPRCLRRRSGAFISDGHVAVAVSCCLEMALWRTLWMADQVSRMASGGLFASFMRLYPRRLVVSSANGQN